MAGTMEGRVNSLMFWPAQSMGGLGARSGGAGVTLAQGRPQGHTSWDGAQACEKVTDVWCGGVRVTPMPAGPGKGGGVSPARR